MDLYNEFLSTFQRLEAARERQQRVGDIKYRQLQEQLNTYKRNIEVELPQLFNNSVYHVSVLSNLRQLYLNYVQWNEKCDDRNLSRVHVEQEIRWIILQIQALLKAIPKDLKASGKTTNFKQKYQVRFNKVVGNNCNFGEILVALNDLIDFTSKVLEVNQGDKALSIDVTADNAGPSTSS